MHDTFHIATHVPSLIFCMQSCIMSKSRVTAEVYAMIIVYKYFIILLGYLMHRHTKLLGGTIRPVSYV